MFSKVLNPQREKGGLSLNWELHWSFMVYMYTYIADSCLMLPKFQSTLTSEYVFMLFIRLLDVEDILKNGASKHRKCLPRDLRYSNVNMMAVLCTFRFSLALQ